ncbi:MAG: hypothetical protein Q9162_000770 [Coniocarpon cinnabarinum]
MSVRLSRMILHQGTVVQRQKLYTSVVRRYATKPSDAVSDAVSDASISRLAAKPLHPLTLADLVRLATLLPFADREISSAEDEAAFTEALAGLVQTHSNTIPILARGFLESRRYINAGTVTEFLEEHLRARIGTRLIAEQHIALHHESQPLSAMSAQDSSSLQNNQDSSYVGIIDTSLRPAAVMSQCESFVSEICELNYGVRPTINITGDPTTRIAHVPVHLEYILTELLKNSFRATIEQGTERHPIEVTIAPSPPNSAIDPPTPPLQEQPHEPLPDTQSPSNDTIALLQAATPGVTIRIRDRGGGIAPENYANLWNYGFTTFNEREASTARSSSSSTSSSSTTSSTSMGTDALNVISASGGGGSSLAGLGYGLPLGRAYAEYFGGGIAVQSLWGWGTDVYLTLKGVGGIW